MIPALDNGYFRTSTLRAPAALVDERAGRILGAKIIQAGDTNDDRPITIDGETLAQVVALGNQPNRGIKARFAHPSMSDDGLGRYIGRWTDFRLSDDGQAVLADLAIAESSHETPEGDLGAYVLELAKDDPEAFGVSIVSGPDAEAMETLRKDLPDGARVPLRLSKLRAADFVDEPAATRGGLFSMDPTDPRSLAAIAAQIIDTHFADSDPEDVLERFARMLARHYGRKVETMTATEVLNTPEAEPVEQLTTEQVVAPDPVDINELAAMAELTEALDPQDWVDAFGDRGARWYLEGKSLEECYRIRCSELEALAVSLETRLQAALQAGGEDEPLAQSIELSEEERRAIKLAAQVEQDVKRGIPEKISRWSRAFGSTK
jgi:hypothetical protein